MSAQDIEQKKIPGMEVEARVLTGQVAVVTGACSVLGTAIARKLAELGAKVAAVGHSQAGADRSAALTNKAAPGSAGAFAMDVAEEASVQAVAQMILGTLGKVNILVNHAGLTRHGPALQMSAEDWDAVIKTNLTGAFQCVKAFQRSLLKQSPARIINISSAAGLVGGAGQANYAASQAGLIGLTKSLAREFAPRGVTVNAVVSGLIDGEIPEERRQFLLGQIPLGTLGEPEDIAGVVAFLAGPEAKYVTGQVLAVDGGMMLRGFLPGGGIGERNT